VPWPDASKAFAPGGFVPSQSDPTASAPVCAPGFSLLLAPVVKLGGQNALFAVTPMAGALLVWLTFLAGRALAGPLAGAMAAVLVATSPVVLYQVVQPMNDVTTAALWMAVFVALASRRWAVAGICCGLALLVRPNLLPLTGVAGIFVLAAPIPNPRSLIPIRRAALFSVAALPCVLIILWLNASLYGGPLRSAISSASRFFRAMPRDMGAG
jgi:asparagine N-glycosylation enzyme membrane subunit Stt3